VQVYTRQELQVIADLCVKHDTLCISDEVYEWLVYTGHTHVKIGTDYKSLESECLWSRVEQLIGKDPRPALK
jgi:aspartate/methionine/tyrosine aminotransferase